MAPGRSAIGARSSSLRGSSRAARIPVSMLSRDAGLQQSARQARRQQWRRQDLETELPVARRGGATHSEGKTALNEDAANDRDTGHAVVRIRIARLSPVWKL